MPKKTLTAAEKKYRAAERRFLREMQNMQNYGWAVVAFTDEEVQGADTGHLESRLCELGFEVIDDLRPRNDETDEDNDA